MKNVQQYVALCLTVSLLIRTVSSVECYSCNTRDHEGCDGLDNSRNSTLTKTCSEACAIMKAQWGNEDPSERKYMLWRGCGPIVECTQAHAMCCHCKGDYCNFGNICVNRGLQHAGVLHLLLFCAAILHIE